MIEFHWLKFNFILEHSHDKPVARMAGGERETDRKREVTQTGLIIDMAELGGQVKLS